MHNQTRTTLSQRRPVRLIFAILLLASACASGQNAVTTGSLATGLPTIAATNTPLPSPTPRPSPTPTPAPQPFDGQRAWEDVDYQVSLGPRTPGSLAHSQTVDWIVQELEAAGWDAQIQETEMLGHPVRNVIGRWGEGNPWIILGAHFDSRMVSNRDPDPAKQDQPVPGGNDGASGVAVLLEMARILPAHIANEESPPQVWLVFFDAEDQGNLPGWDWILGSRAFVDDLVEGGQLPDAAVIVDMIGDTDLNVYKELNSNPELTEAVWATANRLGYSDQLIPEYKYRITDDHIPFLQAGIPAVDLIDFDYPYWHTTEDTAGKVSPESLQIIGDTLLAWLLGK